MKKKILVFEGIDGCGKTSVINEIKNILDKKSIKCDVLNTPHMISNIRELLKKSTADKFAGKNKMYEYNTILKELMFADKVASVIPGGLLYEKVMNSDTEVILLDRFLYSYLVYNCKDAESRKQVNFWLIMREIYDITDYYNIYLYLDPKIANMKIAERGEEREATELNDQTELVCKFNKFFRYDDVVGSDDNKFIYLNNRPDIIYRQYHNGERDSPKKIAENLLSYIFNANKEIVTRK